VAIQRSSPTRTSSLSPTGPDIGYAMIFPGMTIVKILFVDIVPAFF
jgi:putative transport protein